MATKAELAAELAALRQQLAAQSQPAPAPAASTKPAYVAPPTPQWVIARRAAMAAAKEQAAKTGRAVLADFS